MTREQKLALENRILKKALLLACYDMDRDDEVHVADYFIGWARKELLTEETRKEQEVTRKIKFTKKNP